VPPPLLQSADARALYVIVERMLAKRAEDRFVDAEALVAALKGQSTATPTTVRAPYTSPGDDVSDALYGTLSNGPRPAAALDRALAAGFEMLEQQRPRVDAGLEAGRRAIAEHAPRVRSLAGKGGDRMARVRVYAAANQRRFSGMLAAATLAGVGLYYSAHFALHHRSRCPSVAAAPSSNPPGDSSGAPVARHPFSLMIDDAGAIRQGGSAQVYYDVCGLEKGAGFTTRVTISKSESGLNRLFGRSVSPVTEKFEERAGGPAVRRHRTLDMAGMPGGSYWVNVVVTDEKNRRREEGTSLRVRGE
jgi:hypothetical protein